MKDSKPFGKKANKLHKPHFSVTGSWKIGSPRRGRF